MGSWFFSGCFGLVYYAAQILFFGAEFTQVYARRYGSQIVPEKNAIPLTEEASSTGNETQSRSAG